MSEHNIADVKVGDEITIINRKRKAPHSPMWICHTHTGRVIEVIGRVFDLWMTMTVRLESPEGVKSLAFLRSGLWEVEIVSITRPEPLPAEPCSSVSPSNLGIPRRCEGYRGHAQHFATTITWSDPEPEPCHSISPPRMGQPQKCWGQHGPHLQHWAGTLSWSDPVDPADAEKLRLWQAWQEGVVTALNHAQTKDDGSALLWLDDVEHPNPYEPPKPQHRCYVDDFLDQMCDLERSPHMQRQIVEMRRVHLQKVQP